MLNDNRSIRPMGKKLTSLFFLVSLIFSILLVSMMISGVVSFLIVSRIPIPAVPGTADRLHRILIMYMALVSLLTGTILARFAGKRFLRQISELAEATKEIASGNFNIHLKAGNTREIDMLTNSFNEMAKELSTIETLRADFVSNISHEFKTPVASIRGFARRLKKDSLSNEQRNEYLDIIISESERLTRLSSNVLLLSSLESTEKISDETVYSLDEQIRRAILLLEPQLQQKRLDVDVNLDSVQVNANEEMLSHLWINLLGNAIKFSPEGDTISVSLGIAGGEAIAKISDMGPGMDDEVIKRIFDKFYQGEQSRTTEGNGLGLSLVKRILELENGRIEVESEPGRGSCFTVSLPVR